MLLPNWEHALIEEQKVVKLNPDHMENGGKAAFFFGYGYTAANWTDFATAIREMIAIADVAECVQSIWGDKYVVDGRLKSPRGVTPPVSTIWIVDKGKQIPRLVTAYPGK